MKLSARGAAVVLALAGCAERPDPNRLVRRTDFDISRTWQPQKLMGFDFLPCFRQEFWTAARARETPPLGIYTECVDLVNAGMGVKLGRSELREGAPSKTNYAVSVPKERRFDRVYTFEEAANAARLAAVDEPGREKYPFFFQLRGDRPSFLLDASYPLADRDSYREWRAAHPNCLGALTLSEYDQQAMWYRAFSSSTSNKTTLAQLRRDFPLPQVPERLLNRDVFPKWAKECFRRVREFYFGEESIWTLHSGTPSLSHIMAELGASGFLYEATTQSAGSWAMPGAFSRGAARQFGIPFGWYTANFVTAYDRAGKLQAGENSRALKPVRDYAFFGRDRGASRSLMRRQATYGWLIGANVLEPENWYHYHREEVAPGRFEPSAFAKDLQELCDFARRTDRGIPYTPIAILCPIWERINRSLWNRDICDPWSFNAFALTLEPIRQEQNDRQLHDLARRRGDESCFFNSPFGGIWDVVCPDATRNRARIDETLGAYKAAFLVGDFRRDEMPDGALERYVRAGGTLFVSADKIVRGVVSPELAGVAFGESTVTSGDYTLFLPVGETTAVPHRRDAAGNVVVWKQDVGRGRLVTVACDRMLPDAYATCRPGDYKRRLLEAAAPGFRFAIIHDLLEAVQREVSPVRVEGDVQWGVNRTRKGWLVWLFNNKGVTKFIGEPEILDESQTATVSVRCGQAEKVVRVSPGGIAYAEFESRGG